MPIYTIADIESKSGPFNGWGADSVFAAQAWESKLPSLDAVRLVNLNPSISAGLQRQYEDAGRYSVASGLRNCVARISMSWGYFQSGSGALRGIFKDSMAAVSEALSGVNAFFNSEAFNAAINSVSWVPVVGWIIKIIVLIAKQVVKIVKAVQERRQRDEAEDAAELAKQWSLPRGEFDPDADEIAGRELLNHLSPGLLDFEWMVMPPSLAMSPSDFEGLSQKVSPGDTCRSGWLIRGKDNYIGGLGFIPGTMNIHQGVSLAAGSNYGLVRDMGAYYPVTQTMAASIWAQAVKGDSGLVFACDTDSIKRMWMDYVHAAMQFAVGPLSKGWSVVAGNTEFGSDKFKCGRCDQGLGNCGGGSKDKSWSKWRGVPDSKARDHQFGYIKYFQELFDWKMTNGKPMAKNFDVETFNPDKIDFESMIPSKFLDNMYERQVAMINSPKCMYLDDSTSAGGSGQPRFKAIKKGSDLHELWEDNVQAMFESGDWMRIDYRDVIKGEEVDQALHNITGNMATTPDKFFNMDSPAKHSRGRAAMKFSGGGGPSVLGDPTPPTPPNPIDFEQRPPRLGSGKKAAPEDEGLSTGAKVVLGGAVAALGYYGYTRFVK